MLPTSHYDKDKADRAVRFMQSLRHTIGEWAGQRFMLLPWQEQIVRDVFGIVKNDTGYRQFHTAYIEIPKKMGKQLALDTLIPTPTGFTTMGEIKIGDALFDDRGQICHVVGKSPVDYEEQAYRITFKDGEVIEAGERHLWTGEYTYGKPRAMTLTTGELYRTPREKRNETSFRFHIRIAGAIQTEPKAELPIEPYLMGYWLGNGNAIKPEITIRTCDIEGVLANIEPFHRVAHSFPNVGDSRIFRVPDLRAVLVKSFHDKKIPAEYLRASYDQRLRLLQGLMDSDGAIGTIKGQAIYTSTERGLAESVSELLWSLGIKNAITLAESTVREDWSKPSKGNRRATGETIYYVKFTAFDDTKVAGLERKQTRAIHRNERTRSHYRYIDSIEPIENRGMQCIQVDSPSHLYLVGRSCLPTHNSTFSAAVALKLLCADGEPAAEIYSCASDRQQAGIIFREAADMVRIDPVLSKVIRVLESQKRMVYLKNGSFYQVLSAEAYSKHGFNIHGLLFDELHAQPNRKLFDVMTKGSGDARRQPLFFLTTTAGDDTKSVCYEQHKLALDILSGKKVDPTFYPVVYAAPDDADWTDPKVWRQANPSLGITISEESVREWCERAKQMPSEENTFRQLRLCQWVKQAVRWMPMKKWEACGATKFTPEELEGRPCYGGLDLSSTGDITSFVLVFPPKDENGPYYVLPYFWIPEERMKERVARDKVPYNEWAKQGFLQLTEGDVIHYGFIEQFIVDLGTKYNIREIAFDRWGATQMSQNLEEAGFSVIPFGQGFKDMSPPTKELMNLTLAGRIAHGGNPILNWMMDNVTVRKDPAGNIKMDKEKSTEKIDGCVATVMALDRAIRNGYDEGASVYDDRGVLFI